MGLRHIITGWEHRKLNVKIMIGVEGDPEIPKTTWYNEIFLRKYVWKKIALFYVDKGAHRGYRVGYMTENGDKFISTRTCLVSQFRALVGHENLFFFTLDLTGKELPLELIRIVEKGNKETDKAFGNFPLF